MINLTEMQAAVLKAFPFANEPANVKTDLGMSWTDASELSEGSGLTVKQVKGVLSSLSKKGLVFADEVGGNGNILQCLSEAGCDTLIALTASASGSDNPETPTENTGEIAVTKEEKATRTRLNIEGTTVIVPTGTEPAKGTMAIVTEAFEGGKAYAEGHAAAKAALEAQEKQPKSKNWVESPDVFVLGYVKGAIKEGYLAISE